MNSEYPTDYNELPKVIPRSEQKKISIIINSRQIDDKTKFMLLTKISSDLKKFGSPKKTNFPSVDSYRAT